MRKLLANVTRVQIMLQDSEADMTFTVYGHEVISGSDVGMHFSASLALATGAAEEYGKAMRLMDPLGEPVGPLGIFEFMFTMPDIWKVIDILNSPQSVFPRCLSKKRIVGSASS